MLELHTIRKMINTKSFLSNSHQVREINPMHHCLKSLQILFVLGVINVRC